MNNNEQTMLILILILVLLILLCMIVLIQAISRGFSSITRQIKQSIIPRSLTISPATEDVADMAVELWRLEKRLSKTKDKLSDDENKALGNAVEKLRRFVQRNDVEVTDYAGQTYNEGMNLDILSSEKDPDLKQSIVHETHEPAVSHKGILIRKAKVIIHEK